MNNLSLCHSLIRPVESPHFPLLSSFPISQVVTFRFYVGRLAMFDGNFKKAEEELSFAFQHCSRKSVKNKRLVLLYLIPVKIILGIMPKQSLLERHNFSQFSNLCKAVQTGNLLLFNETMSKHERFFIQHGIYLILEKAKILTFRNFFRKAYLIMNNTKLSLTIFADLFRSMNIPIELDEIECILANLIFKGFLKGYISHSTRFLVVSAKNAFPDLRKFTSE